MSQKRRKKVEKLKSKRAKTKNRTLAAKNTSFIKNPYESQEAVLEDMEIMHSAMVKFYGDISEDFHPPLYEKDEHGLKLAGWIGVYRDLMLEKYKSLDLVEPRVKFNLMLMADS